MKVFVSAYAAAPPSSPWNRGLEAALYEGLSRLDLAGLELPFTGKLHEHDDSWLIAQLQPDWRCIVSLLHGTMSRLKDDKHFGLASADKDGRRRALDFADSARRAIETLHGRLGRKAVAAVALHSAPRLGGSGARSSLEGFADSLTELRGLDWGGAELLVEHCDAAVPSHAPDKGFLRLDDECAAINISSGPAAVRVLLNWGRSAIEARSAEGPLEHIERAKQAELLAGIFFSGATPNDINYGEWKDSHAPFSTSCPASILTPAAAKAALKEAGELSYLGLKIQPLPAWLTVPERIAMIRAGLDAVKS